MPQEEAPPNGGITVRTSTSDAAGKPDRTLTIRTFLIADIRGYTRFTNVRGDEPAARLAEKFAEVAGEGVEAHGGELIEIRGDEALAVFGSARRALRAAVELQAEFAAETEEDGTLPLHVGIGLDAGEAVRVGEGFRGGALNLAARLCSQAAPGEVLASQGVVHLARTVEGIRYESVGAVALKGLDEPVSVIRVVAEEGPAERLPITPDHAATLAGESLLPEALAAITPLAGRDADVRWLRWAWRRSRHGQGRGVFLAGPTGIGKTRLAAELAVTAHRGGATILHVGGSESRSAVELLAGIRPARRPTLVVADGLEAAGSELLSELASLVNDLPLRPIMVLGTYRDEPASVALQSFLARIHAPGDAVRRLEPLGAVAVTEIIAQQRGPHAAGPSAREVLQQTGGVPALVHHYLAQWAETAPQDEAEEAPVEGADDVAASSLTWLELATGAEAFVGREQELQALQEAWSRASEGRRVLALLAGEPGIGKTTLAAQLARGAAADGGLVLYGRWDEELLAPYQAFRQALGDYARACPPTILRRDLREAGGEISRLFPEVAARIGVSDAPLRGAAEAERFRLFEAVDVWLEAMASRRPVLIVLDDLHWADRASLLLLQHLMRTPRATPLLVVGTYRHTELAESELGPFLAALARDSDARRLSIGGLSAPNALTLLGRLTGREPSGRDLDLVQSLQEETAGNPFFLREILRHLRDVGALAQPAADNAGGPVATEIEIPETVRDVVRWRLNRLTAECGEALAMASVIGQEFDLRVLGPVVGGDDERLLDLLDEAARIGLVAETSRNTERYAFSHAVVRRVLLDGLSGPRRARLHRRIGETLETLEKPPATPAELAYHFGAAAAMGVAEKALRYARLAGDRALQEAAYESAVRHYREALDLLERSAAGDAALRCELLLALADAHDKAGEYVLRDQRFLAASEAAGELGRVDLFVRAALGYGGMLPTATRPDPQSLGLLEEALQLLGQEDSALRARTLARMAHSLELERPYEERLAMSDDSLAMARRLADPGTLSAVLFHRAWALQGPDDIEDQLHISPELLRLGRDLKENESVLQALRIRLGALFEGGEFEDACETAADLARLAREARHPEYLRIASMWEVVVASLEGRFDDAERMAEELHLRLQQIGHPQSELTYVGQTIGWRWLQGRAGEYLPIFEALAVGDPATLTWPAAAAWCAAESGATERAGEILQRITPDAAAAINRNYLWCVTVASFAHAAAFLGDRSWAAVLYDLALPYADQNCTVGVASFNGAVSYFLGVLAGVLDRFDDAALHLEAALERHASMRGRAFTALTEQAYAAVLAKRGRSGDRERASELLESSLSTARELGLGAVELRARLAPG